MEILWKPSFSATCLYAADAVREGLAGDGPWTPLAPSADQLCNLADRLPPGFWELAVALAGEHPAGPRLAEAVVQRLAAEASSIAPLAAALGALEQAVRRIDPQLESSLPSRLRPIQEQWEARGPGFHRALAAGLDGLVAPRAAVHLVHPLLGGGGRAHPALNCVTFEGVLYHPTSVPEMVRLGWLLAQLPFGESSVPGHLSADRRGTLVGWATLPAVRQAAEAVQWSDAPLAELLQCWSLSDAPRRDAERLDAWWADTAGRTWPQRLAALRETFT